jgi:hypothetical protein
MMGEWTLSQALACSSHEVLGVEGKVDGMQKLVWFECGHWSE